MPYQAAPIRAHFTTWAYHLDVLQALIGPAGGGLADALEAIGVAARAATLRFGPRPVWGVGRGDERRMAVGNTS
jgi:hypothetical protein